MRYVCKKCGKELHLKDVPVYCPYCGDKDISSLARDHAMYIVTQMQDLVPSIESAWDAYVKEYVKFENLRREAKTYVQRGHLDEARIPTYKKQNLLDALYQYRAERKLNNGN